MGRKLDALNGVANDLGANDDATSVLEALNNIIEYKDMEPVESIPDAITALGTLIKGR